MKKTIYGCIVWFVATLFVVYSFCLNTAAAVFSASIKSTLHASDIGVTLAVGAFVIGFACMQIPAGYLLDKYKARYVVSAGVLVLALGNILTSYVNTIVLFSLANLIQGAGASFAFIASGILISRWFPAKMFPILFGLTQTVSCVSAGIIHYLLTIALQDYSWKVIYEWLSIYGFIVFVLTLLLVTTPPDEEKTESISLLQSLTSVLRSKQIVLCALAAATSFGVLLAYASLWYMPVQKYYLVENTQAVIISGMIFTGLGIGTPILGWFSNLAKSRLMIVYLSLVLGNMALLLGLYLPHYQMESLIPIKIVSFFIGFLLSGSMLFYTIVSEAASDSTRGVALSVINTSVFLFNTIMMFLPYLFITTTSSTFFTYLWILPFCIMISILIIYFIKETYPAN